MKRRLRLQWLLNLGQRSCDSGKRKGDKVPKLVLERGRRRGRGGGVGSVCAWPGIQEAQMVPNLRFRGKLRTSFPGSIFSHAVLAQPWTFFVTF